MREIKFRGRRKNSDEWVYGAFLAIPRLCSYIFDVQPDWQATRYLVDEDTVGQFTGYRDRDGVEIYEDDLIAVKGEKYLVIWDRRIPGFALRPWNEDGAERLLGDLMITFFDGALVIGNIHHDGNGHVQYSDCEENGKGSGGDA